MSKLWFASIAVVAFAASFVTACEECSLSSDCEGGEICSAGECRPSTVTDAFDISTDPKDTAIDSTTDTATTGDSGATGNTGNAGQTGTSGETGTTGETGTSGDLDTSSETGGSGVTGETDGTDSQEPDTEPELCDGKCKYGELTKCTCDVSDPCGWVGDGTCQGTCAALGITKTPLDDSDDCPGLCDGMCGEMVDLGDGLERIGLFYTSCTCGIDDPCGLAQNGRCDYYGCTSVRESVNIFDDRIDCAQK